VTEQSDYVRYGITTANWKGCIGNKTVLGYSPLAASRSGIVITEIKSKMAPNLTH